MATIDMGRRILDQQQNNIFRNLMNVGGTPNPGGAFSGVNPGTPDVPGYSVIDRDRPMTQRLLNTVRGGLPAALKTARLVPGLGLLATGGLIANSLLQEDDIDVAQERVGWVARALDPRTITTQDNETVRSATSRHSKTGKWIVYPTIRSVDGKLVKLKDSVAKARAEELGDFVTFSGEEEATEFSKNLSKRIGETRRAFNQQNRRGLL